MSDAEETLVGCTAIRNYAALSRLHSPFTSLEDIYLEMLEAICSVLSHPPKNISQQFLIETTI